MNLFRITFAILISICFTQLASGQPQQRIIKPKEKASPVAMATFKKDKEYLKVTYGQPYKREREVFGGLVPYDKIWRTGANEATEITLTKDIKVSGKTLKAGTYTIFSIPRADKWTIIFNSELGQWGDYKYQEFKDKDVMKVDVSVAQTEDVYEAFTIKFAENKGGIDMMLIWDKTMVVLPIAFI